jgi:hypothetical protein
MPVELMGDAIGMGVRVLGEFDRYLDSNTIRIKVKPDLEMIQRRLYSRQDHTVGIRYTKARGTLRSYRDQWKKNIEHLEKTIDLSKLRNFPRNQVNISPSGSRIPVKPPIAEVAWLGPQEDSEVLVAGMQFSNIRKSDLQHIGANLKQKV